MAADWSRDADEAEVVRQLQPLSSVASEHSGGLRCVPVKQKLRQDMQSSCLLSRAAQHTLIAAGLRQPGHWHAPCEQLHLWLWP